MRVLGHSLMCFIVVVYIFVSIPNPLFLIVYSKVEHSYETFSVQNIKYQTNSLI